MTAARAAAAALVVLALAGCARGDASPARGAGESAAGASTATVAGGEAYRPLDVGDAAPVVALRTLAGDSVRVGPGEPLTLVNVWATWCTACREEMADLERLHRDYRGRGLRVVAVSVDEGDGARVRRFVAHERLTMPVAHDADGRVQAAYQPVAVPESYLIGADGRIRWRHTGGLHGTPAVVRQVVEAALRPGG